MGRKWAWPHFAKTDTGRAKCCKARPDPATIIAASTTAGRDAIPAGPVVGPRRRRRVSLLLRAPGLLRRPPPRGRGVPPASRPRGARRGPGPPRHPRPRRRHPSGRRDRLGRRPPSPVTPRVVHGEGERAARPGDAPRHREGRPPAHPRPRHASRVVAALDDARRLRPARRVHGAGHHACSRDHHPGAPAGPGRTARRVAALLPGRVRRRPPRAPVHGLARVSGSRPRGALAAVRQHGHRAGGAAVLLPLVPRPPRPIRVALGRGVAATGRGVDRAASLPGHGPVSPGGPAARERPGRAPGHHGRLRAGDRDRRALRLPHPPERRRAEARAGARDWARGRLHRRAAGGRRLLDDGRPAAPVRVVSRGHRGVPDAAGAALLRLRDPRAPPLRHLLHRPPERALRGGPPRPAVAGARDDRAAGDRPLHAPRRGARGSVCHARHRVPPPGGGGARGAPRTPPLARRARPAFLPRTLRRAAPAGEAGGRGRVLGWARAGGHETGGPHPPRPPPDVRRRARA